MANVYPQLALVTDAICAAMENTLVAAKLLRWKTQANSKISPTNRFQYIERVPPRYNMRRWSGAISSLAGGKQDTVFGAEIYALNDGVTLDFAYEDFAHIRDEDQAARDSRLKEIGSDAGGLVDAGLLNQTMLAGNNWTGTPGAAVDDIEALIEGYVRLKEQGVADGEMFAVLPYSDMGPLAKFLTQTTTANRDSQEAVLAKLGNSPRLKELVGMQVLFSQQVPKFTTGTANRATTQIDGTPSADYATVSQSTTTNGQFLTQLINLKGLGNAGTLKDGEIFTITGVNAWDNRQNATLGRLQQFRVIGNYTAESDGTLANVRIFPAIIVQNQSSPIGTVGVNNANATVDAAPTNSAPVTFVGAANTTYIQRAVVARSVGRVESAQLEDLPSGENASRKMRSIPLTMRAYRYANGDTGATAVRFDCPFQFNVEAWGRVKVCRIGGS